jgi:lysine 2,3-aminomutase
MDGWPPRGLYTRETLRKEAQGLLEAIQNCASLGEARERMFFWAVRREFDPNPGNRDLLPGQIIRVRDCARAFAGMVKATSDERSGFSFAQALLDIACGRDREDLQAGFFADVIHMVQGIEGRAPFRAPDESRLTPEMSPGEASRARSAELDAIWAEAEAKMDRYEDGLSEESILRREKRRGEVLRALGGKPEDWNSWKWHVGHSLTDAGRAARVLNLSAAELRVIEEARKCRLPFGITPYYAHLIDSEPSGRDRAVRAQVLPPVSYVDQMAANQKDRSRAFDFMGEAYTSPIDLITRRYPAILILKPYNSCPQICVYCQRNWEIDEAMAPDALAPWEKIQEALGWIAAHPAIREVLITGGDPLTLGDVVLKKILDAVASNPRVDVIRIGSRTPVTVPMRITDDLVALLGGYRRPGRRELCLVTHVEHPYEITPEMVAAVDRLKRQGINVFNQQVYTFFTSRRFETARLRMLLRRIGIDPYYTFVAKGKEETNDYRVPIARMLQEQKEEARLLPGLRRTDEVVYNVPRLGKTHARAYQHRDLIGILPDGSRIYEFHPWEKNIIQRENYVGSDVPILGYLQRLAAIGEDPDDYMSIWYYF